MSNYLDKNKSVSSFIIFPSTQSTMNLMTSQDHGANVGHLGKMVQNAI